jgi:branched-chain amino acid transport system substrate-binding protein
MRNMTALATIALAAALSLAGPAMAQQKGEILIGTQCDRTGPTQIVGIRICPAFQDYVNLVNSKGGVEGFKIVAPEIDNEYKVPPAVEAYERQKQQGAVSMSLYGTPQVQALNQKLEEDKIPSTSPGFGISASADGKRFPYLFPVAATYWSQGAAAVKFIKDKIGGDLKGKKIAYVFYDNPAGREPVPILEDLQKTEGYELRTFAVPPPGVEMGAQVLDITQRYRPDFIIDHLFGRSPSVAIKEYKRAGFPLTKVIGLVWASAEADIDAAGGWQVAEGYHTMQFAGAGDDFPVRQDIKAMYKAQGKEPPEQVKQGFESLHDFNLGGLVPPLKITGEDHEGGGWVQVFQAKGGKFVKETDWFRAYPEVVSNAVKKAE